MTDNLLLKIGSLVAAVLLAYSVNSDRNSSVLSFAVPIELKNAPEDKALLRPAKLMTQVTLRGPSFLVGPIASAPPPFRVVVPDKVGDRLQVALKGKDLSLPSSIEVLTVEPSQVELVFEPVESKEIKVEVPRIGQLAKHLSLVKVEVDPRVVAVRGPSSELQKMKSIETEPLVLDGIEKSETVTLALRNSTNKSSLQAKSVAVKVAIEEVPRQRVFEGRSIELRTSPNISGVELEPTEVEVGVEGPPDVMGELDPSAVVPFVRVREVPPVAGVELEVSVDLPRGCRAVKIDPKTVKIFREGGRKSGVVKKSPKGARR